MERVPGAESEEQLDTNLSSWQGGSHNSYADSSITFGSQSAFPMDQREARRLVMKRKVLRHRPDGRVEVFDESPNTKPWSLGYSRSFTDDTISDADLGTSSSTLNTFLDYDDDDWLLEDSTCSLLGDIGRDNIESDNTGSDNISEYSIPGRPPMSYIAPRADRVKRTDPVAKLNQYRQDWKRFSFPGQDSHQGVRWAMRRWMLQSELPRRVQKRIVPPNAYEVPTMKKRDSLRFGVRWDLAHNVMPRRSNSS